MRQSSQLLALAASLSTASAATIQGLNYGSLDTNDVIRDQANFQTSFATAKALAGTNGAFTSARLYTMVQGGTQNTPISAIPAAIAEGTTLLLGLWTSGTTFPDELAALKSAISTYGDKLTAVVDGISVGSEDLYRNSPTGIAAGSLVGQQPDVLVDYISQVREAIAGTSLSAAKVGHVDTWTAWVNSSNAEVINAIDWLGFDGYPYWQSDDDNTIANAKQLFLDSYDKVLNVAGSKEVWVTETGWAVSDTKGGEGKSVASIDDAKIYWDDVGCGELFGQVNTWWYMLNDANASPSFGITSADDNTTPLYNLTCPAVSKDATSSSSPTTVGSAASAATASEILLISASASSAIASLSSVAATATGAAKSSALAAQTSVQAAASSAASSIANKATATSASASKTSSSTSTATSSNAAVPQVVSVGGVIAAAMAAALVL